MNDRSGIVQILGKRALTQGAMPELPQPTEQQNPLMRLLSGLGQGIQNLDWGTIADAGARMALLPQAEVIRGVGRSIDADKTAAEELRLKRLMDMLGMKEKVLEKQTYSKEQPIGPGWSSASELYPGVFDTGYIKKEMPFEIMMRDPTIGPVIMKALGGSKNQGPFQMYNPKTKDWATADNAQDIAQGYSEGYVLYNGGK